MHLDIERILVFGLWLAAAITATIRFRHHPVSIKVITFYLWGNFGVELFALLMLVTVNRNVEVYNIYTFLETILLCLYFNYAVPLLKKYHIGLFIGGLSVILGVANLIWLQPINVYSSYLIVWEALLASCLALFAFARLLIDKPNVNLRANPHFWICTALAFYWSIMFSVVGITGYWNSMGYRAPKLFFYLGVVSNIIAASLFMYVFLRHRKWIPQYD